MTDKYWEHFEHDADIGIRGVASTQSEAFEQAALALTAVITDVNLISPTEVIEIECEAPDIEILLVDWLNSVIYEMATRKMLFSKFNAKIRDLQLKACLYGETLDISKHQPAVEIKGATYTALSVRQYRNMWFAECVLDV